MVKVENSIPRVPYYYTTTASKFIIQNTGILSFIDAIFRVFEPSIMHFK
jgi:hypothetical protein